MLQLALVAGRLAFLALLYFYLIRIVRQSAGWLDLPSGLQNLELVFESVPAGIKVSVPAQGGGVSQGDAVSIRPPIRMGRERGNDIIFEDPFVSGTHAEVDRQGGIWRLRDLESKNGTFHNGSRINRPVVLARGDRIQIGESVLVWKG